MKPSVKVTTVVGGYLLAVLVASGAIALRVAATSGPAAQASSGMYAFGDAILFVAIFGVLALVPTGAALYFLRPYLRIWKAIAALGLIVAFTGITAAMLFAVGRHAPPSPLATLAGVSVLRILVAPLFALMLLVCAVFSPDRQYRFTLIAATAMEVAVSAYGGCVWFLPLLFQGR